MPLGLTRSRFFRRELASLAPLLLDASQPRFRNVETQSDQAPLFVRIARGEHLAAKFSVVRFHQDHLLEMNPNLPTSPRSR
jgi:hypothetical protein